MKVTYLRVKTAQKKQMEEWVERAEVMNRQTDNIRKCVLMWFETWIPLNPIITFENSVIERFLV